MILNYFNEKERKFFYKEKDNKIDYCSLFSFLKNMALNYKKTANIQWISSKENFTIKITKINGENSFEFKINESPKLHILGKKKIFFKNEIGNIENQIYIYNIQQLIQCQTYFIIKNEKEVEFFDQFNNLITTKNDDDLFNSVHYYKVVQKDSSLELKQKEDYYKKIFDCFISDNFENEGERLSFNLSEYTGQKNEEFIYLKTVSRNEIFDSLDDFFYSKEHYFAITGVSGTGKTITLLKFLSERAKDIPYCYFNIKILSKVSSIKYLALEFVKLFNKECFYNYYIQLIRQMENNNDCLLWDKIVQILDFIITINKIKEKIIIVFDQYKIGYDPFSKLLEIIQLEKYKSRIKFIICSSIHENDIKTNLTYSSLYKKLIFKNMFLYKFIDKLLSIENVIQNDDIKDMMKQFNFIPKYYYLFIKKQNKRISFRSI